MPFATAPDGVRIHYELEGSGPPLVLQHGLLSSMGSWRSRGYIERFAPKYQCVLVDSRGHGESDKPDDPEAYELRTRVVDVASVLHDAGIETAHYLGYSMGGWIGYGIAIYMPQRFRSLTIGGFSPLKPPAVEWATVESNPVVRANPLFARSLDDFPHAMRHSLEALRDWRGARQAPRTTALPLLMFAGSEDPNEAAREMPPLATTAHDATFFAVAGADHGGAADAVDVVVPRVMEFIDRVEARREGTR